MSEIQPETSKPKIYKDSICPFCGLLCDDLTIENNNNQLSVTGNSCARTASSFRNISATASYRIAGEEVSFDDAIQAAKKIIKTSKLPLISGLGTDVEGTRAALALADKKGAYLDHMSTQATLRNYRVLQDRGYILTTLTEVKNRADLIIFAGTDIVSQGYSSFFDRFVWNEHSLFDLDINNREIIYIGEKLKTAPGTSPSGKKPTYIKCKQSQVSEVFGLLNALLAGHEFSEKRINGISMTQLAELKQKIESAKYGVVAWSPASLDYDHAELTVESLCNFVRDRNVNQRFGGISIGGDDGSITANNVSAWQSGYPLPIRYTKGYPEYDPHNFSTTSLIENEEIDSVLWISSFGSSTPSPNTDLPTIVLADSMSALDREPEVFISVGTPGIDHGGQMIRTDSVVSLTLSAVRQSELPSVHSVLTQLTELV